MRKKSNDDAEIKKLIEQIKKFLKIKKAGNIRVLDVATFHNYLHYIIICEVSTRFQAHSLWRDLEKTLKGKPGIPYGIKNQSGNHPESGWVLLDLGEIIVHITDPETTSYYNFDKLYEGAKILK